MDAFLLDITQVLFDPSPWLQWVLGVFTSWRLGFLVVYEDGPWGVFVKLRVRIVKPQYHDGRLISTADGMLPGLLSCVLCMTFWTTPVVYAILWAAPWVIVLLATWAAASYLETLRPKD